MIPTWLYNIIILQRERKGYNVNLDLVLENIGEGGKFDLVPTHPKEVSIKTEEEFYIKPTLKDAVLRKNSKIILFSAPGATGKSALARYISRKKHALLWDLSMDRIANHSYSGMLVEALGTKDFSRFTQGLVSGEAVLVVDALDEAEMISGRAAIETLLMDLRSAAMDSERPNIVLCARTETAHFVRNFYTRENSKLDISQYEISFFQKTDAIEFVKRKIVENRLTSGNNRPVTAATIECIKALFDEIERLLDYNEEVIFSLTGYAPVLEALAVFCDEESNTMQMVQRIHRAQCSAEIFQKIMEYILTREQRKVINGFRERCIKDYPDFNNWSCVYSEKEQLIRLINYVLFNDIDLEVFSNDELPRELLPEYQECVASFLKDHPFIHMFDRGDYPKVDFTGPAFRDYVLSRLMTDEKLDSDSDDYAQCYFSEHGGNIRFPSQLYFDLYEFNSKNLMSLSHFKYLYDAFKAKERTKFASSVVVEQVGDEIFCTFKQDSAAKANGLHETEFNAKDVSEPLHIVQLNNGYIDIDADVILGSSKEDVIVGNSTIKCRKLIVESANVMLTVENGGELLIACGDGIDVSRCPNVKFEIRSERDELLRISTPDINEWYKLKKYQYDLENEADLDVMKFENAVRAILKYFRKHHKDAPGKHREYIENVIVGGSQLKRKILGFFIERGIIYQDSKDPSQYKLNNVALEALGVNWGMLSPNSCGDMKAVLSAYKDWEQKC